MSVSLPPELVEEAERMEKRMGFANRSELFRAGLESLQAEHQQVEQLKGKVTAVLTAMHSEPSEARAISLRHDFHDIIVTSVHHEFPKACIELFLLEGAAERVHEMYHSYKRDKSTRQVRLFAQP